MINKNLGTLGMKPAVNRMNVPRWRVNQSEIGYLNIVRIQELDQVWPSVV